MILGPHSIHSYQQKRNQSRKPFIRQTFRFCLDKFNFEKHCSLQQACRIGCDYMNDEFHFHEFENV
jgi:hypothetical protein